MRKKMKFIAFYEYKFEDIDKVLEKGAQALAIREKAPERFPKAIFDFNIVGETKGVAMFETDSPDQLCNLHYIMLLNSRVNSCLY